MEASGHRLEASCFEGLPSADRLVHPCHLDPQLLEAEAEDLEEAPLLAREVGHPDQEGHLLEELLPWEEHLEADHLPAFLALVLVVPEPGLLAASGLGRSGSSEPVGMP